MKKQFKNVRIYSEDWEKVNNFRWKLSNNENNKVSFAEILRRTWRIPIVQERLFVDSVYFKRRKRKC